MILYKEKGNILDLNIRKCCASSLTTLPSMPSAPHFPTATDISGEAAGRRQRAIETHKKLEFVNPQNSDRIEDVEPTLLSISCFLPLLLVLSFLFATKQIAVEQPRKGRSKLLKMIDP
jgi:hypothetical protein